MHWRRNRNRYPSRNCLCKPSFGTCLLQCAHVPSIVFVCAPVIGSLKVSLRLTVIIVVFGKTYSLIIERSVTLEQFFTIRMKHSPVSRQIPPNTQSLQTFLFPFPYFRFTNLDSSISTVNPSPPIRLLAKVYNWVSTPNHVRVTHASPPPTTFV